MVVDDEKGICDIFRKIFSKDYKVSVVHCGEKGIEIFKKKKPKLVIVDHHMPGINGKETVKRIKEINIVIERAMYFGGIGGHVTIDSSRR